MIASSLHNPASSGRIRTQLVIMAGAGADAVRSVPHSL